MTKICITCLLSKPLTQFAARHRNRMRSGAAFVYVNTPKECKQCEHTKRGQYRKTDAGKATDHRAHLKYYAKNKEKVLAKYRSREFRDNVTKKYLQTEKGKATQQRFLESEKGKIYLQLKYARHAITRQRQIQATDDLTKEQWQSILDAYQYCCAYCGTKPKRVSMDHVLALSKGGAHTRTNVVPSCWPCNHKKLTQAWIPHPPINCE